MNARILATAILFCSFASTAFSAPNLVISPGGVQAGNWVWDVSITPDLSLNPDHTGTPIAFELGFRLTGDPLVSVSNINPSQFGTNNPGKVIFGWETRFSNNFPGGIEVNCEACTITNPTGEHNATIVSGTANEIFAAMGSLQFTTPGTKPFLKITALGPGNGGPQSSTLEWLGAYATKGIVAQITGKFGQSYTIGTFDFAGSATQFVPEPATTILLCLMVFAVPMRRFRRRAVHR